MFLLLLKGVRKVVMFVCMEGRAKYGTFLNCVVLSFEKVRKVENVLFMRGTQRFFLCVRLIVF